MKILYIVTRAIRGGVQIHLLDILRGYQGKLELILVTGQEGFLTEKARELGVKVYVLPTLVRPIHPLKDIQALGQVLKLIRQEKPDLIHTHSAKSGLVGRLAGQIAKVPVVHTDHGWAFTAPLPWQWKMVSIPSEWLAAHWCSKIITVSEYELEIGLRYKIAPPSKLVKIYCGVPDTVRRANPGKADEVNIAMVARFDPQKNHILLLQALSEIKLPFRLLLVGDGSTRSQVEDAASKLNLVERVEFLGSRDDIDEILSKVHIFVLATHWESFGIVSVEAMRAMLPVVGSDVGGVSEVVVEGETGFLVPSGDVIAMRDRLAQLIADPQLRIKMGKAGRKRYEENFTIEQMLDRILEVYQAVLANRPMGKSIKN
ncbi:MAG: glycosyltransferase family 4 protein [Hydrococcus sp. Prado102]|jgi:glycosyltransferase involved in cell wall biosynthesis|nr:glycosyltransferase family 4 protein [Hydrococcus sp. Prado102]